MLILAAPRATLRRGLVSLCLCALFGAVAARADDLQDAQKYLKAGQHAQDPLANVYQAHDGVTTSLELELGVYPVAKWYDELAGKMLPLKDVTLTLEDGKYTLKAESIDKGTYTIDAAKKPKEMDIKGTDGPNKGKSFPAIYELSGDTLRICYDLSGKARPTEFKTTAGTKLFLATYKRKKP